MIRLNKNITLLSLVLSATMLTPEARAESFDAFVQGLASDAASRGVSKRVFKAATAGLRPDLQIDKLTRKQPELVKPIGAYIERRRKGGMVSNGRKKVRPLKKSLKAIEKRFGVDPYVVAGIWGMESGYGANIGKSDVFRSLATLGWKKYRGDFFRDELLDAMVIKQKEKLSRKAMIGSWAGAVGQTQFIPSSFLKFAVDMNGDGKRDLWRTTSDALGSTANYLAQKGWIKGQPWGRPIELPGNGSFTAATMNWSAWAELGARSRNGKPFPKKGKATLFYPAGEQGPAFLITANYEVIRDYNSSDAYSLSVAMIADRLRGGKDFALKWPSAKTLNKAERMKVQKLLAKKGYDVPNRTGRIIKGVRTAIRDFQLSKGLSADGYPDQELLRQLLR